MEDEGKTLQGCSASGREAKMAQARRGIFEECYGDDLMPKPQHSRGTGKQAPLGQSSQRLPVST